MFPIRNAYRPRSIIVAVERLAFTIHLFFAFSNGKRKLFMYENAPVRAHGNYSRSIVMNDTANGESTLPNLGEENAANFRYYVFLDEYSSALILIPRFQSGERNYTLSGQTIPAIFLHELSNFNFIMQ